MRINRWILALPLAFATILSPAQVDAATILDPAGLFSREAVEKAERELARIERASRIPVTVETVDSLQGARINDVLADHARRAGARGLYILIAKREEKIWVEASRRFPALNGGPARSIKQAFIEGGLKSRDFDAALLSGVQTIGREFEDPAVATAPAEPRPIPVGNPQTGFGLGSLLALGALVFAGVFLFRMLGTHLGGGGQRGFAGPSDMMGGPVTRGGGGFFSGLLGGLGGAIAGNWIYNQFNPAPRRYTDHLHGGYDDSGSLGDDWSSTAGSGGDWGGGGDGGDWGGGGGDWGGGGSGDDW
ncbi:MAG: TPM domain-containing protein [Isosphaeraceae bacterium]